MSKTRKKLFGAVCLAIVAVMTTVAIFLPEKASAQSDAHTDVIRATVYDQYPAIKFTSPEDSHVQASPFFKFKFDYENSSNIKLTLKYYAEDPDTGEVILKEIPLEEVIPPDLDPTFDYASGTQEYDIDLAICKIKFNETQYDIPNCVATRTTSPMLFGGFFAPIDNEKLVYNHYWLLAESYSPVGYATDEIEFYYVPAYLVQTGADEVNGDPEIDVYYDQDVAKLGLEIYDKNGKLLSKEPIILENEDQEGYAEGKQSLTLPFGAMGLASGDYYVKILAYDLDGEIMESPYDTFKVTYAQPSTPDVPDTGGFLGNLNITKSDYVITGIIVFTAAVIVGFVVISRNKKKDYRKNYRNRR